MRLVAKRVLTHPFNIATALGAFSAATGLKPPHAVDQMLVSLKEPPRPSLSLRSGLRWRCALQRRSGELALHLPIKLILHPLLVWVLLSLFAMCRRSGSIPRC